MGKKKKSSGAKANDANDANSKHIRSNESDPKVYDKDMAVFLDMARDMKEEGNKLFQKRDYQGALLKYENAVKFLPNNHFDIAHLHSSMAACYMQMGPDYHQAIKECDLALEASPKYSKALLKRAQCFEALSRLDLACRDVNAVLNWETNNAAALEFSERLRKVMEEKGTALDESAAVSLRDVVVVKEKPKKNKNNEKAEDKVVTEERFIDIKEESVRVVKLVLAEDIRCVQIPANCSVSLLREIVGKKFPSMKGILIKYRDREDDLVTISTSKELRLAEESAASQGSIRFYLTEVTPEHEPCLEDEEAGSQLRSNHSNIKDAASNMTDDEEMSSLTYVDDWILQFAQQFKNYLGFGSDLNPSVNELDMKMYSEAIEDTITSEDAQESLKLAQGNFQEMAALALFNWGNLHVSRARGKLFLSRDASKRSVIEKVKDAYDWALSEYTLAGRRYAKALKVKPDFYEGLIAVGQLQFEQAKLLWYYAIGTKVNLEVWPSAELFEFFNNAEDNMKKGMNMWKKMEQQQLKELSKPREENSLMESLGLDGYCKQLSLEETAQHAASMKSHIYILWGTILYERSIVEFKLGIPSWEKCLAAAVEKFKLARVSPNNITAILKKHLAKGTAKEELAFKIDQMVKSWKEIYDAEKWMSGVSTIHLEPQLYRKDQKLLHMTSTA